MRKQRRIRAPGAQCGSGTRPERRFRMVDGHRVMVVKHMGFEGFFSRWTDSCSGCFEAGEYMGNAHNYPYDNKARCYVGGGCDECGYTGKRRHCIFIAFEPPSRKRGVGSEAALPPLPEKAGSNG